MHDGSSHESFHAGIILSSSANKHHHLPSVPPSSLNYSLPPPSSHPLEFLPFPHHLFNLIHARIIISYCVPPLSSPLTFRSVRFMHVFHHAHCFAQAEQHWVVRGEIAVRAWLVVKYRVRSCMHYISQAVGQPEAKLVGGMHVIAALMRVCHPLKAVAGKHAYIPCFTGTTQAARGRCRSHFGLSCF